MLKSATRKSRLGGIETGVGRFTRRFDGRAGPYSRYRPGYPPEILQKLEEKAGFGKDSTVADIGSGTGILSELFLKNGNTVYCVEPNIDMRRAAEKNLKKYHRKFISVDGTAEATGLKDASVDLIAVGQALHWFDPAKTRREFKRILRKNGYVFIVYNWRKEEEGATEAYSKLTKRFSKNKADVPDVNKAYIRRFLSGKPFIRFVLPNYQALSFNGLLGRLASASYAPRVGSSRWVRLEKEMKEIFDKYSKDGVFTIRYDTTLYMGQLS